MPLGRKDPATLKIDDAAARSAKDNPALPVHFPAFAAAAGRHAEVEGTPALALMTTGIPDTNAAPAPPPPIHPPPLPPPPPRPPSPPPWRPRLPAITRPAAPRPPVEMPPLTIARSVIAAESRSKEQTRFSPMYLFNVGFSISRGQRTLLILLRSLSPQKSPLLLSDSLVPLSRLSQILSRESSTDQKLNGLGSPNP